MIAKAVEICELQGLSHLIYGSFVYYAQDTSLTEFKRRNGFEKVMLPQYYVPLTLKGKIAVKLGFHRGLVGNIPRPVLSRLLKIRSLWYARRFRTAKEAS